MSATLLQRFCDGWGAAAFLPAYNCLESNVGRTQLQKHELTRPGIPYLYTL